MNKKIIKQGLLYFVAVGFSIFLLFFFITSVWIGYEVKSICQDAEGKYGGDCVEALISQLKDDGRGFRARNDAIWALGQLGDARALSVLQEYYTGNIPDRESLDGVISQYELKKAVNLTAGGKNISAFVWRGFWSEK